MTAGDECMLIHGVSRGMLFTTPNVCTYQNIQGEKTHVNSGSSVTSTLLCFNRCLHYLTQEKLKSIASPGHSVSVEVLAGAVKRIHLWVKLLLDLDSNKGKILTVCHVSLSV